MRSTLIGSTIFPILHLFMAWLLAYFIGSVVVPTFYGMIILSDSDNKFELNRTEDAVIFGLCHLLWVIFIPSDIVQRILETRKARIIREAKSTVQSVFGRKDRYETNTSLVEVDEDNLKLVIYACRKNFISISAGELEAVRNELCSRNMERNLLK